MFSMQKPQHKFKPRNPRPAPRLPAAIKGTGMGLEMQQRPGEPPGTENASVGCVCMHP